MPKPDTGDRRVGQAGGFQGKSISLVNPGEYADRCFKIAHPSQMFFQVNYKYGEKVCSGLASHVYFKEDMVHIHLGGIIFTSVEVSEMISVLNLMAQ